MLRASGDASDSKVVGPRDPPWMQQRVADPIDHHPAN